MYRQKNMYRRLRDNPGMVMPGIPQRTVVLLNIFVRNGYSVTVTRAPVTRGPFLCLEMSEF